MPRAGILIPSRERLGGSPGDLLQENGKHISLVRD